MIPAQRFIFAVFVFACAALALGPQPSTAVPYPIPVASVGAKKPPPNQYVNAPSVTAELLDRNDCMSAYYAPTYVDKQNCMQQGWVWLTYAPNDAACPGCLPAWEIILEHRSAAGSTISVYTRDAGIGGNGFYPTQFTLKKSLGQWNWGDCWVAKGRSAQPQIDSPNSRPACLPSSAPVGWMPLLPTPHVPSRVNPPSLIIISNAADCGKLTPGLYGGWFSPAGSSCEGDLKAGGLWTHWSWTKLPCGAPTCLDIDTFILDHRPGISATMSANYKDAFFAAGKWRIGDCFQVHARNSIENVTADSNTACVPRFTLPLSSPPAVKI